MGRGGEKTPGWWPYVCWGSEVDEDTVGQDRKWKRRNCPGEEVVTLDAEPQ